MKSAIEAMRYLTLTAVVKAIEANDVNRLNALLKDKDMFDISTEYEDRSLLFYAVFINKPEAISALVNNGAVLLEGELEELKGERGLPSLITAMEEFKNNPPPPVVVVAPKEPEVVEDSVTKMKHALLHLMDVISNMLHDIPNKFASVYHHTTHTKKADITRKAVDTKHVDNVKGTGNTTNIER